MRQNRIMKVGHLEVEEAALQGLCVKWGIARLEAFGSVLRPDFRPGSDVDLLVSFRPGARISFSDLEGMEADFATLFGRSVEVVSRSGVESSRNYLRRRAILESAELLYAA